MEEKSPPPYPANDFPRPDYTAAPPLAPPQIMAITTTPQFLPSYGPQPQHIACPYCHKQITTKITTDPSMRTHLLAALLCMMCCLGCIPYCIKSCQNRNHYCPECDAFLGTYDSDGVGFRRF